jgi:CHAT domain-containing protein
LRIEDHFTAVTSFTQPAGAYTSTMARILTLLLLLFLPLCSLAQSSEALLGQAYRARSEGRLQDARAAFLLAIVALERENGPAASRALAHKNLGDLALTLQDNVLADDHFRRAMQLRENLPNDWDKYELLLSYCRGLRAIGRFDESYGPLDQAIGIVKALAPDSTRLLDAYTTKGGNLYGDGRWKDSYTYLRTVALPLIQKISPGSIREIDVYSQIADALQNDGKREEAFETLQKVHTLNVQLRPNSVWTARSLLWLAGALIVREPQKGLAMMRQAHARFEVLEPNRWGSAYANWMLASAESNMGQSAEAEKHADACWQWFSRNLRQMGASPIGKIQSGADPANAGRAVIDVYLKIGKPEKALQVLQDIQGTSIARQLVFSIGRNENLSPELLALQAADEKLGAALQEVAAASARKDDAEREVLEKEADKGSSSEEKAKLQQAQGEVLASQSAVAKAQSAYDSALDRARRRNPTLFPSAFALQDCSRYIPEGALYVSFLIGSAPNLQAMSVTREGVVRFYELGIDLWELRDQVNELRAKMVARSDAVNGPLRNLYERLFPNGLRQDIEKANRLIITPDGPLWEVPFAALLAGPQDRPYYLGLSKPLVITPSLSLYGMAQVLAGQKGSSEKVSATIIGDPRFGESTDPQQELEQRSALWTAGKPPRPLPGTRREAEGIASLYETAAKLGDTATEAALTTGLRSSDVVHVATHGLLNNDYPLASGLLLSAPTAKNPDHRNDGAFLAWEVFRTSAQKTKLLVLSACETGLGRSLRAQGVDGLVRSFQIAGVPSIVSSLWKVEDESTAKLMKEFHGKVRAGEAYDEAIRQAMIAIFQNEETRHPYFWAPFFLTGDQKNSLFPKQ